MASGRRSLRANAAAAFQSTMRNFGYGKSSSIDLRFTTPQSPLSLHVSIDAELEEDDSGYSGITNFTAVVRGTATILKANGQLFQALKARRCKFYIGEDDDPYARHPPRDWARNCAQGIQRSFKEQFLQAAGLPPNTRLNLAHSTGREFGRVKQAGSVEGAAVQRWREGVVRAKARRKLVALKAMQSLPPNVSRIIAKQARIT